MGKTLEGRVAVVTGSGQGIGRAIAMGLAEEGAKIVTNNRRKGSTGKALLSDTMVASMDTKNRAWLQKESAAATGDAETTADAIKAMGGNAMPFFGDIADFDTAAEMIAATVAHFGKIDILVNVAGTFGFDPIQNISEATWDRVTQTKPKGYFNAIRHAVPHMIDQKWGRILNCTSRAFLGDVLKHAEYCAANAGVVGLTRAVAMELAGYGITCNAFSPWARTRASFELAALDMVSDGTESPWMDPKFSFPLDITPGPEHIAPYICYLASEEAAKISGSIFSLAGNNIGLYSEPQIVRSLTKPGAPWTVEELKQQAPMALFMGYNSIADLE